MDMLRSVGKQSGESVESARKKKRKTTVERVCRKRKVVSLDGKSKGVMDDESDDSMEPMEEVPLCHSKDWVSQSWRDYCVVHGEKPGVHPRDEGKQSGRSDLLFVEKMM